MRGQFKLGRVISTNPDSKGIVRDVNVRVFPSYSIPVMRAGNAKKPKPDGQNLKVQATVLHRDVRRQVVLLPVEEQGALHVFPIEFDFEVATFPVCYRKDRVGGVKSKMSFNFTLGFLKKMHGTNRKKKGGDNFTLNQRNDMHARQQRHTRAKREANRCQIKLSRYELFETPQQTLRITCLRCMNEVLFKPEISTKSGEAAGKRRTFSIVFQILPPSKSAAAPAL